MHTRSHRVRNLVIFGLLVGPTVYLLANLGIAWIFVYALGHPPCSRDPQPLPGRPAPAEITLHTQDHLALRGWYYPPRNGAVIIALGGAGGSLGQNAPPVDFLLEAGYGALQIDSRACATPTAPVTLGANEAYDAAAAVDYLQSRPEALHIGVYGFSMGGAAAIRAAALRPEIAAVIAEGGYANLGRNFRVEGRPTTPWLKPLLRWMADAFRLQYGLDPDQINPQDDLARISPRPVLLIYGSQEASLSDGQQQYAAAGEPKTLWIVPGGTHGGNYALAPDAYRERVLAFFDQYLR